MTQEISVLLVILAAIGFDFVNGFHDAANSIATIVATRVLTPRQAVFWAAAFNVIALFLFGTGVAATVGNGMIDLDDVTPMVILAGLLGAVVWGLITWLIGFPTSSSHSLLGGYAGASIAYNISLGGAGMAFSSIIVHGWTKTLLFIVLAPLIGLILSEILMRIVLLLFKSMEREIKDRWFGRMQLFSSAFLSVMHGGNDAQKTAGIVSGALVAGHFTDHFTVPIWVLCISYITIGLGTLIGGWRIVDTMGRKLTRLTPASGFCSETAAALSIMIASSLQLPVSTTQAVTGAIVGGGAARRMGSVRWALFGHIIIAWSVTIPVAAAFGALIMAAFTLLIPR